VFRDGRTLRASDNRIGHPDGVRKRSVGYSYMKKASDAGLIVPGPASRIHGEHDWFLTDAGRTAAAALPQIQLDDLFVWVETTPEKLQAGRDRSTAAKVVEALIFNRGRLRGRDVLFERGGELSNSRYVYVLNDLSDAVMAKLAPHVEPFIDVDGQESLRITEAGIVATIAKTWQHNRKSWALHLGVGNGGRPGFHAFL
jgi:hypothetical protein